MLFIHIYYLLYRDKLLQVLMHRYKFPNSEYMLLPHVVIFGSLHLLVLILSELLVY